MICAKYLMRRRAAVLPDTVASRVVSQFSATGLPGLAVVDKDLRVIGVITEFDILGALREGMELDAFTAERVMSKDPITASIRTMTPDLISMMLINHCTVIPILNKKKQFVGIVSRISIMDSYISPVYDVFRNRKEDWHTED